MSSIQGLKSAEPFTVPIGQASSTQASSATKGSVASGDSSKNRKPVEEAALRVLNSLSNSRAASTDTLDNVTDALDMLSIENEEERNGVVAFARFCSKNDVVLSSRERSEKFIKEIAHVIKKFYIKHGKFRENDFKTDFEVIRKCLVFDENEIPCWGGMALKYSTTLKDYAIYEVKYKPHRDKPYTIHIHRAGEAMKSLSSLQVLLTTVTFLDLRSQCSHQLMRHNDSRPIVIYGEQFLADLEKMFVLLVDEEQRRHVNKLMKRVVTTTSWSHLILAYYEFDKNRNPLKFLELVGNVNLDTKDSNYEKVRDSFIKFCVENDLSFSSFEKEHALRLYIRYFLKYCFERSDYYEFTHIRRNFPEYNFKNTYEFQEKFPEMREIVCKMTPEAIHELCHPSTSTQATASSTSSTTSSTAPSTTSKKS